MEFYLLIISLLVSYHIDNYTYNIHCLSAMIILQRTNELYKTIQNPYIKLKPNAYKNTIFTFYCINILILCNFFLWLLILLLLSGDIHPNPGPDSVETDTSISSMYNSLSSFDMLSSHLSIIHLNIQSLLPKIDIIRCEGHAYDVLVFTENWLKPQVSNNSIHIDSFTPPHRTDRHDGPGVGVAMYVCDFFTCKPRADLEIHGLEAVWLELQVQSEQILVDGFYHLTALLNISTLSLKALTELITPT